MSKTLHKEVWLSQSPESVWVALTDPKALAEWLMPNNFEPRVGHTFRFHVDPMPGFSGISECRVLEVEEPSRLVYTWTVLPKVLERVEGGRFTPGAVTRRDYGTKTVPDGYAK